MSDHGTFDELAVGWALHALEPEDEAVFAVHLPGCERCAATVAETAEVMASLAAGLRPVEPSGELAERLRSAVAATGQRPGPAVAAATRPADGDGGALPVPRPGVTGWRRALPTALVAAAVATILGLGIWNVVLAQSREELRSTVAQQEDVLSALLRPGEMTVAPLSDDGAPVATVVARRGELAVVTHGLAANDAARTSYVVWGLGGEEPIALGTFDVGGSQTELRTVGSRATGLDGFPEYAISLEAGQEAPSRPTAVVATGEVTS
jgi:anti-sigma factor RsiW